MALIIKSIYSCLFFIGTLASANDCLDNLDLNSEKWKNTKYKLGKMLDVQSCQSGLKECREALGNGKLLVALARDSGAKAGLDAHFKSKLGAKALGVTNTDYHARQSINLIDEAIDKREMEIIELGKKQFSTKYPELARLYREMLSEFDSNIGSFEGQAKAREIKAQIEAILKKSGDYSSLRNEYDVFKGLNSAVDLGSRKTQLVGSVIAQNPNAGGSIGALIRERQDLTAIKNEIKGAKDITATFLKGQLIRAKMIAKELNGKLASISDELLGASRLVSSAASSGGKLLVGSMKVIGSRTFGAFPLDLIPVETACGEGDTSRSSWATYGEDCHQMLPPFSESTGFLPRTQDFLIQEDMTQARELIGHPEYCTELLKSYDQLYGGEISLQCFGSENKMTILDRNKKTVRNVAWDGNGNVTSIEISQLDDPMRAFKATYSDEDPKTLSFIEAGSLSMGDRNRPANFNKSKSKEISAEKWQEAPEKSKEILHGLNFTLPEVILYQDCCENRNSGGATNCPNSPTKQTISTPAMPTGKATK